MPKRQFTALSILAALFIAGCSDGGSRHADPAQDARDVAKVERLNEAPLVRVVLEPITGPDVASYGLVDGGCRFHRGTDAGGAVLFIARADEGVMKIDGQLQRLSPKEASARIDVAAHSAYVGLAYWTDIVRQPADPANSAPASQWPARLFVHDGQGRVVFMADGLVACPRSDASDQP